MNDERGSYAPPVAPASDAEFHAWADRQPARFGIVDGRRVRLAEEHQGAARLAMARAIAARVLGGPDAGDEWLETPAPDLDGRTPADMAAVGDEGSRLALLALVRRHRREPETGDG